MAFRVVHYINQFYAGIGGEEKADYQPEIRDGVVGPGMALKKALGAEAEVVATVVCGDSYFASNMDKASAATCRLCSMFTEKRRNTFWVLSSRISSAIRGTLFVLA